MKKWIWLLFSIVSTVLLASCSSDDNSDVETITITDTTEGVSNTGPVVIKIILNTVNMRASPSMNSPVVAKLAANSELEWLHQVSKVTAPVKLRGVRYNDPWVYVKTDGDVKGWVYAATVKISSVNIASVGLKQQLLNRRVETFFGRELAEAVNNYRMAYVQARTSDNFANMHAYGISLRDRLVQVLESKVKVNSKAQADMSWLDRLLPGYTYAVVDKGRKYYLFADYKKLNEKVSQTKGDEDNQMVALYQAIFPEGREGFFPVWMIQTKGNTAISRLGSGVHKSILDRLENLIKETSLFTPMLTSIKQELVDDITNVKTRFAEKEGKRKIELNTILNEVYSILSDEDVAALKVSAK